MAYAPFKNTFTYADMYPRSHYCSDFGDLCSSDADCFQSCGMGVNAGSVADGRMVCAGSAYEKSRHMGKCTAAFAAAGDPCAVGIGPLSAVTDERSGNTCGPSLYCQQTLDVDSRPNTAPSFAAPSVGQGYCMPPPVGKSRVFTQAYKNMVV